MDLNFVHTRQPGDQSLISRVADQFLSPRDKSLLSRFLGGQSPKFTLPELQSLSIRAPEFFEVKTNALSVKNPMTAMYLYALTIDHYLNYIRQLEFKLQNMQNLESLERKHLDHEILAPDFRIWPFHDRAPWSGGYMSDDITDTAGEGLGVRYLIKDKKMLQKSPEALSLDERIILYYTALHILASLAQGLFLTEAKGTAKWVNAAQASPKAAKNRTISAAAGKGYLATKLGTNLDTFLTDAAAREGANTNGYGDRAWDDSETAPPHGGAIGFYTTTLQNLVAATYTTAVAHGDITSAGADAKAALEGKGAYVTYSFPKSTARTWDTIKNAMASDNALVHCPKLSEAFIQSGVNRDLNSIYYELQKMYMQRRNTSTLGISPQNALEFMNYRNKSDGYASTFNCGPGMTPRFIGHDGKNVDLKDAVITRNGRQYVNTALVDPDRSYCTAVIPVAKFNSLLSKPFPDAWNDKYGISASAPIPFDAKAMLLEDRGMPMAPMGQGPSGPMPRDPQGSMFGPEIVLHDPYGDAAAAAAAMEARYGGKKKKKKTKGGKKKKGAGRKKKCSYK